MPRNGDFRFELRGVIYREDEAWIAHCLELDIVAEGQSPEEALKNCIDLCSLQIEVAKAKNDLDSIFRPAPPEFWTLFFSIRDSRISQHPVDDVERFEARELEPV